jgi:hypothetical protein
LIFLDTPQASKAAKTMGYDHNPVSDAVDSLLAYVSTASRVKTAQNPGLNDINGLFFFKKFAFFG